MSNKRVSYRETIQMESPTYLVKSPNKRNRYHFKVTPLSSALIEDIESGRINDAMDPAKRNAVLVEKHGLEHTIADNILCFAPEHIGPNLLIDSSGGKIVAENQGYCISGFQWITSEGILAEELIRGVALHLLDYSVWRVNLYDCVQNMTSITVKSC